MDVARSEITTVNAAIGWKNRDWEVSVSILNPLDGTNADIAYFYTSKLAGEPLGGIADKHLHPAEPRTVRLSAPRRL